MENTKKSMDISVKSFISAIIVIFALMVGAYILSFVIPGGVYERDADGLIIEGSYTATQGGIPFWKWVLSPFLILGESGSAMLIAIIIFLLVIGGVFEALTSCGLINYMLERIVKRFGAYRYKLMFVIVFFFMALGSLIGSFEECVPLVPIIVALAIGLGWDAITGFAMSLLAVGCGFAAGVFNPFTVGVAQRLADLPMFSGVWLRALAFVLIYGLLMLFTYTHAKKVEKPIANDVENNFVPDKKKDLGLILFGSIIGLGIVIVLLSPFLTFLQDYTMIIIALAFLIAGISSCLVSGMSGKDLGKKFFKGLTGMLPAVIMILMASSIKYILEEALVLDTILTYFVSIATKMPKWSIIIFIYLIVLIMNFFIASGSAKAFMLIPLIIPIAEMCGIPPQLCIVAFAFGDGFSNVMYPTNPALLISLSVAGISYGKWFKWSSKFQLANLVLTSLLLLLGLLVGYGL